MSAPASKGRVPFYDNARFLLMGLVLVGHFISLYTHDVPWTHKLYVIIYSFHIPAFALVSGMLAPASWSKKGAVGTVTRLLVPYLVFQVIYSVLDHLLFHTLSFGVSLINPYKYMWFLLSLATWRILLMTLGRMRGGMIIAVVAALAVGYLDEIGRPLTLARTIYFFPYFFLGHLLKTTVGKAAPSGRVKIGAGVVILALLVAGILAGDQAEKYWFWGSDPYSKSGWSNVLGPLLRFGIMVASGAAALSFLVLVPRRKTVFTAAGSRTIYPYLTQGIVIHLLDCNKVYPKLLDALGPIAAPALMLLAAAAVFALLSTPPIHTVFRPLIEPSPKLAVPVAAGALLLAGATLVFPTFNYRGVPVIEEPGECVRVTDQGLIVALSKTRHSRNMEIVATSDSAGRVLIFDTRRRKARTLKLEEAPGALSPVAHPVTVTSFSANHGLRHLYAKASKGKTIGLCGIRTISEKI